MLWTTTLAPPPSPEVLEKLKINWVLYAGSAENCLPVIQQVKALLGGGPQLEPRILLSNSCASSRNLLKQRADEVMAAFLTHPMLANTFPKGYRVRGRQAYELSRDLIQGADRSFHAGGWYYLRWALGFHNVADARYALRAYMEKAVDNETFSLGEQLYTFAKDGTAKEAEFHLWRVKVGSSGHKYEDADAEE